MLIRLLKMLLAYFRHADDSCLSLLPPRWLQLLLLRRLFCRLMSLLLDCFQMSFYFSAAMIFYYADIYAAIRGRYHFFAIRHADAAITLLARCRCRPRCRHVIAMPLILRHYFRASRYLPLRFFDADTLFAATPLRHDS